jgi:hypothetical protein
MELITSCKFIDFYRDPATKKIKLYPWEKLMIIYQVLRSPKFLGIGQDETSEHIPAEILRWIIYWWCHTQCGSHRRWAVVCLSAMQGSIYPWEPNVFDKCAYNEYRKLRKMIQIPKIYARLTWHSELYLAYIGHTYLRASHAQSARRDLKEFLDLPPANPETTAISKRMLAFLDKQLE